MKHLASIFLFFAALSAQAQYNNPYRMTYDGTSYYVTNKGNGTVTKLSSGTTSTVLTGLTSPNDIFYGALAGNSILLVIDNNIIKIYDSATLSSVLNIPITNATEAHDAIFNPANPNEFFISDRAGNKIIKGSIGAAPFYPVTFSTFVANITKPAGMIVNNQGKLIVVSDSIGAKAYEINPTTGGITTVLNTSFSNFNDVAQDSEGNYYITCWGNNNLYRYSNAWTAPTVVSTFNHPSGLYADLSADLLGIVCTNCQKVEFNFFHLFSPASDVSTCIADSFYATFLPAYKGIGTYNSGNKFQVEMSDSNGSFFNYTVLGSVTATTPPTTLRAAVPLGKYAASGYKYRFASTAPVVKSYFTKELIINPDPNAELSNGNVIYGCIGSTLDIKHSYKNTNTYKLFPSTGITVKDSITYSFAPTVDTTYSYLHQVTSTDGCSATYPFTIEIAKELKINLQDTLTMCEEDTISLGSVPQSYKYLWIGSNELNDASAANPSFFGNENTKFIVQISDSNNVCYGLDSIYVTVNPKPIVHFTLQELEFCLGDTIFRDFTQGDSLSFTYINNDQTPLSSGGWLADSIGRFGYELVYSYITTGCSDVFGNGYGVHYKDDSIRISNKGDHLKGTIYGTSGNQAWWFINEKSIKVGDTLSTNRLQDGDSIFAISLNNTHCKEFSNTIIWKTLGVNHPLNAFHVYPNPSSGTVHIVTSSPIKQANIYDLSGRLLQNWGVNTTSLETYGLKGMYILEVETTEGIRRQRLLMQ
jgi:hypothetical protein